MTSSDSVQENLAKIERILEQATETFDLLVLPENFAQMASRAKDKLITQEFFGNGVVQDWLAKISKQYQCWLVAGSFPIRSEDENRPFARCLVYSPKGEFDSYYDKIHLFDVAVSEAEAYCESNDTFAGNKPQLIEISGYKVGLSICYDLRFPELYRLYQEKGADLILAPSAFTYATGKCHWDILLKSRAIENLCYVAAANQTGVHANGRRTYGHSKVISPWGETLAKLAQEEGLLFCQLDKQKLASVRERFPALTHRKL
ncbi:MAG: carbon-nitrogen hydrolase family protein [Gammaproteobacteria bacterium]|nr:carbon-nitrogen hydrolase family protein [Gammaproteobacteria bacterium]